MATHDRRSPRSDGYSSSSSTTSIHITALDGIVNVNSIFTLAAFLGLAWNPRDPNNSLASPQCSPAGWANKAAEDMVTFHVLSFSSFLFSSLVALCLKQAIRLVRHNHENHQNHNHGDGDNNNNNRFGPFGHLDFLGHRIDLLDGIVVAKVNRVLLRIGILASAVGSVSGCGCLMLALVNVVQIKLGKLGCSGASAAAIVPLVVFVPAAMLIYTCIVFYAFTR